MDTWRKGFTWRLEYRVCGKNLEGELVYDWRSGQSNVLRKSEDGESWVCSERGFEIKKVGQEFELTHPSLDERDMRRFGNFEDAKEGIWEFTNRNVYCHWHQYSKFRKMLAAIR